MMRNTKDDILPSQIVADLFKECNGYLKYRVQFKPAYKHFLSCVGLGETDWAVNRPRGDLRCNYLFQNLVAINPFYSGNEQFLAEIRPGFEAAIATESEIYGQMKASLQIIHTFYANDFEQLAAEFSSLGPELEKLQKNRPTDPEMIQHMDKIMNRFTELQRTLRSMIRPGLTAIQAQHLKALRDCMQLYQKQNENWSRSFALFSKMKTDQTVTVKMRKAVNSKKESEKAEKLAEDERDV